MSKELKGNKILSLLHTNNVPYRETLKIAKFLNNLDHSFSVISVSEAWTPESKSDPETLEDYRYIME